MKFYAEHEIKLRNGTRAADTGPLVATIFPIDFTSTIAIFDNTGSKQYNTDNAIGANMEMEEAVQELIMIDRVST